MKKQILSYALLAAVALMAGPVLADTDDCTDPEIAAGTCVKHLSAYGDADNQVYPLQNQYAVFKVVDGNCQGQIEILTPQNDSVLMFDAVGLTQNGVYSIINHGGSACSIQIRYQNQP